MAPSILSFKPNTMSSEAKACAMALRLQLKAEMKRLELLEQEETRAEELRKQEEERKRQEEEQRQEALQV